MVKGLRILETIAGAANGIKLSEIARVFAMPTSNLTLFLNSLVDTGYVIRNPANGKYCASEKIHHMAAAIARTVPRSGPEPACSIGMTARSRHASRCR